MRVRIGDPELRKNITLETFHDLGVVIVFVIELMVAMLSAE